MLKYTLLASLLVTPAMAAEQAPTPAMLAGNLAQTLSQTLADNDALRARVKDLETELAAAKAPKQPAPAAE